MDTWQTASRGPTPKFPRATGRWLIQYDSQLAQGLEQGGLRPLVHALRAAQAINAVAQTNERRQKPGRRAGIADK